MNLEKVNQKNREKRILELEGQMAALDMTDNANLSTYSELHKIQMDLFDKCIEYKKIQTNKITKGLEIGGKIGIFLAFPFLQQFVKRVFENPDHRNTIQDALRLSNERF